MAGLNRTVNVNEKPQENQSDNIELSNWMYPNI